VSAYRLRKRDAIDVATIERRGDIGGFVASVPLEDQFADWRSDREADVMVSLASLAGERLFFDGDNSSGVGSDLRNATAGALMMEAFHGMGETIASHAVTVASIGGRGITAEDGTDRQFLETEMGRRVEANLRRLFDRVTTLLDEDRTHVLAVAHALETYKTISGEDVAAIIEGHQGPLVDGRSYHGDGVVDEIDTYHEAVVVARKEQVRVALPLPVLNGHGVLSTSDTEIPGFVHAGAIPEGSGNGGAAPQSLPPPSGAPAWLAPPPPVMPEAPPWLPEPPAPPAAAPPLPPAPPPAPPPPPPPAAPPNGHDPESPPG
jgi:hypothetical protein